MIRPPGPLARRFATIVALGAIPVVVLLGVLAYFAYEASFRTVLDLHRQGLVARQAGLAQIASAVRDHVAVMQAYLSRRLEAPPSERPATVQTLKPMAGLAEDENPGPAQGTILAPPDAPADAATKERLEAAESLFPIQRAVHETRRYLKWSYVFDADQAFVTLYPWSDIADMRGESAQARVRRYRSWFDYSIFQFATPAQNPDHVAFWTAAYSDAGGSGLMVTHGAPVFAKGVFVAVVASDVTLAYLTDYLRDFEPLPGKFALVDESGMAIADSEGRATSVGHLIKAEEVLGTFPLGATQGVFGSSGAERFLILGVPGTPWRLIHTVPYAVLWQSAVVQVLPYLAIALTMLLTLLVLYRSLSQQFVWPALRLANYVQTATDTTTSAVPVPEVPTPWRPWVGRVVAALGEQTQLMDRLREAEGIKTAVIDSAIDAVVIADDEGFVIGFNPGAERMFGCSADEAIGRDVGDMLIPDTLSAFEQEKLRRLVRGRERRSFGVRREIDAKRANGVRFPAEIAIVPVTVGRRTILAAYIRDLTEQKASTTAIKRQQQRINQIEKLSAMGSLLAGVAHELNNPLAILMAQATLLQDMQPPPTEKVKTRADRIYAAAQRAGRIVKSFLAMARQKPPVREATQIHDVIAGAVELTAYGLRSAGIEIVRDFSPDVPTLSADPDLLGQVFTNLLINAQQILQDRPGARRIAIATHVAGDEIIVDFSDNGPGVPTDIADRVFEPYFTTKPVGVGTGIGLSICRNVIEAHGGRMDLVVAGAQRNGDAGRSKDAGAHFRISLPFKAISAADAGAAVVPREAGLSVLIVDDEADVASSLAEMIEGLDHRVIVSETADDALELARHQIFDVVFTDLRMPGMSGIALREALNAIRPGIKNRTVIMTGDTVLGVAAISGEGEAPPLMLEKPFTTADVQMMLSRVLVTPTHRV